MFNSRHIVLFILLCALTIARFLPTGGYAQQFGVNTQDKRRTLILPKGYELPSYTWMKEKWTATDQPFIALRQRVTKEVKAIKGQSSKLRSLLQQYETAANRKPLNAQSQYAWAFVALLASQNGLEVSHGFGLPRQVSLAMARPKSPHSYHYARLRFITGVWWRQMPGFADLGLRLLKRNPDDHSVQYFTVQCLFMGSPSQRQQALNIAQSMVRKHLNSVTSRQALANAYWGRFLHTRRRVDGDKAIAKMQSCVAVSPPGSGSRKEAEDIIRTIRRLQAKPGFLKG